MSKLTALVVRNAKAQKRGYKLQDGNGLHLFVSPTGHKSWRYRFRLKHKESICTLGEYPSMSLADARKELMNKKELAKQGIDPVLHRQQIKEETTKAVAAEKLVSENTFEKVAQEWMASQSERWSTAHTTAVLNTLKNDVFPALGHIPIAQITPPMILKITRDIEKRGAVIIAEKVLQRITATCRYAVQTGITTTNPATEMKGIVKKRKVQHQLYLTRKELPEFLQRLTNYQLHVTTRLALRFTILTACRTGEVRGANWNEINLKEGLWEIPAKRMKMGTTHVVPLSQQAMNILEQSGEAWGKSGTVFPGIRQGTKQLSQDTMQKAVWSLGYKGRATVHGFRATFSTIANESGFPPDIIEKALAHQERNQVRAAYNHSEYIEQRREMMQWWADQLDQLEHSTEIPI